MKLTIRLDPQGLRQLSRNFGRLREVLQRAGSLSGYNQALRLFSRSRAVVPYEEGDLYNAAYIVQIEGKNTPTWAVGYDTFAVSYAWDQHETAGRNHPIRGPSHEPKQDHFLSEPRDEMVQSFPRSVAQDLKKAISGAFRGGA